MIISIKVLYDAAGMSILQVAKGFAVAAKRRKA